MDRSLQRALAGMAVFFGFAPWVLAQLGPPSEPPENPSTPEKVLLGKVLFWDEQLSSDNTMACGTCHLPETGGVDPRMTLRSGKDGEFGTRDDHFGSPGMLRTLVNGEYAPSAEFGFDAQVTDRIAQPFFLAGYFEELFWDGRAPTTFVDPETGKVLIPAGGALESQSVEPVLSTTEMAVEDRTWDDVRSKLERAVPLRLATDVPADLRQFLQQSPTYGGLFQAAFGDASITAARIAYALAAYQRSLVPDQTPWDRFVAGDQDALPENWKKGLEVFEGKGRCVECHTQPLFSDGQFRNNGFHKAKWDRGRQNVTGDPQDAGKFKVPSLRAMRFRPGWMHSGMFQNIEDLIEIYDAGGRYDDNLDPLIQPLGLDFNDIGYLWLFLEGALEDQRVLNREAPFDRPTLASERSGALTRLGDGFAGTGAYVPTSIAETPPNFGNRSFKLGVHQGLGGAPAILAMAQNPAADGDHVQGVPLYVGLDPFPILLHVDLAGVDAGTGYATVQLELPDDPALAGTDWYFQWFVLDPGSASASGLSASEGIRVEFF